MSDTISARVNQAGPSTSEGIVRGHRVLVDRPLWMKISQWPAK